jgi:hypothetical protein
MKLLTALLVISLLVGCSDPAGGGELVTEEYPNGNVKSEGYMLLSGMRCQHPHHLECAGLEALLSPPSPGNESCCQNSHHLECVVNTTSEPNGIYEAGDKIAPHPDDPNQ